MTEPEAAADRPGPFYGYGLTLVTLGLFLSVFLLFRMFYPFLPFFLVGVLTVATVATVPRYPRLEAQMSRWLLVAAFIAMTVVTVSTLPADVSPSNGPSCSGPPLCAELEEWWSEHLRERGLHERGIAVLGLSSFIAATALVVRLWQEWVAVPPSAYLRLGFSAGKDALPRLLSIASLALNGLVLWAYWFSVAWDMGQH